jgi:hypothetical protein
LKMTCQPPTLKPPPVILRALAAGIPAAINAACPALTNALPANGTSAASPRQ